MWRLQADRAHYQANHLYFTLNHHACSLSLSLPRIYNLHQQREKFYNDPLNLNASQCMKTTPSRLIIVPWSEHRVYVTLISHKHRCIMHVLRKKTTSGQSTLHQFNQFHIELIHHVPCWKMAPGQSMQPPSISILMHHILFKKTISTQCKIYINSTRHQQWCIHRYVLYIDKISRQSIHPKEIKASSQSKHSTSTSHQE